MRTVTSRPFIGAPRQPAKNIALVTWFHADSKETAGHYPQVAGDSSASKHQEVYLRCVDLLAASARRWNPDLSLWVILNPLASMRVSVRRKALWTRLGLQVAIAENTHLPPDDFSNAWRNQFFVLDCLRTLMDELSFPTETAILLDSDCLITTGLAEVEAAVRTQGRAAMPIDYPLEHTVNGLTRLQLSLLRNEFFGGVSGHDDRPVEYLGGEFFGFTRATLRETLPIAEDVYSWSLERMQGGQQYPREEAQLLSIVEAGHPRADASSFVKRLWTQPWTARTVQPADASLPIWHLPAEKRTGLRALHDAAISEDSWWWQDDSDKWRSRVGRYVGVPRYTLRKGILDARYLAPSIAGKLKVRVGR